MKPSNKSLRDVLARATQSLADAGVASPEADARWLAAELLDVAPFALTMMQQTDVPGDFYDRYRAWVERRAQREPLQHIIGHAPFGPLSLEVGEGVFIPRPETELLADWAVRYVQTLTSKPQPRVVDLGTGSGALAIYVAHHVSSAQVVAVERSDVARGYAARNIEACGVDVKLVAGDMTDLALLQDWHGAVDLVLANPPYVPESQDLQPEVYRDPHDAVFSGLDGLETIRGLVPVAARLLSPGAMLGLEHDDSTSVAVQEVLREDDKFESITPLQDWTGRDRFVLATRGGVN